MSKLKISSAELVQRARARIEEVDTQDAIAMLDDPNVTFVDIRDIRERQRSGFIPGSFHCPRGLAEFWIDPDGDYYKEIFGEDRTFIFHCAIGWRSALTVATLNDMGFACVHLKDGFSDWVRQNGPMQTADETP
ncbi:rhodanese-like domain-containing protein [Yoonia sp. BS5-3]|uniref:Rhodanese-like domain-containing protein n=1 Tax=Yoonia phaeophyticola TaxID=3137369 RepID=A0ABZ2VB84_9RHOB